MRLLENTPTLEHKNCDSQQPIGQLRHSRTLLEMRPQTQESWNSVCSPQSCWCLSPTQHGIQSPCLIHGTSTGSGQECKRIKTSLYPVPTICQAVVNALYVSLHLILQKLYELGFVITLLTDGHIKFIMVK